MELITSPKTWSHLPRDCGAGSWSSHQGNNVEPVDD